MPSSPILKRFKYLVSGLGCIAAFGAVLLAALAHAQTVTSPDQQRLALIQALQKRMPGSSPADWVLGASSSGTVVQAIPLNASNATNSADILAIGKKAWERKFKDGKSFANCFPNGGKRVAATYPQFDAKTKQVVTVDMAISRCLALHGESEITAASGPLAAYFKSLSDGQRLTVRVGSVPAREKFDSGRSLFQRRIGQRDYACASCHVQNAGGILGEKGLSAVVGQAVTWPRLQPGGSVLTLQAQFQKCMQRSGAEPFLLGSEELNNLEYYHAFLSNGLAMRALAVQR